METNANTDIPTSDEARSMLAPRADYCLAQLSDADLLTNTRRLVGSSNQLFAALLAHLAEVEARGVHRTRACSSLYTYCLYELRMSEDAAFRRAAAAKLVKRFPALFEAIAAGELHLTGLLMLGPHLTAANLVEVLARAKHRTKKEIGELVRTLSPLPDVPPRIEPLGPAPARDVSPNANPSWEDFVESMVPVRELTPGDRPRDWTGGPSSGEGPDADSSVPQPLQHAPARRTSPESEEAKSEEAKSEETKSEKTKSEESARLTGPQRYVVQFTTTDEYVRLVERAQALLSNTIPTVALEELHLRAMQALVAELEKRKYAVTTRPRERASGAADAPAEASEQAQTSESVQASESIQVTAQHGRYIPAATRRAVFERDRGHCSYVDAFGQACRETHCLELHHLRAFARGGEHTASNLALRCRAHNTLAAEEDFGRELVERRRSSPKHEPLARKRADRPGRSVGL